MCTVTWSRSTFGYELFFNRDELRTRSKALPPELNTVGNTRYLCPLDKDSGGTWIVANEFGVTLCLLNHYAAQQPANTQSWISRGCLVKNLAISESAAIAMDTLDRMSLSPYRAFHLLALDQTHTLMATWNGSHLTPNDTQTAFVTSSSVETDRIIAARTERYRQLGPQQIKETAARLALHSSHENGPSADSICMHREDAGTVSLSHIQVDDGKASFRYADGPPCTVPLSAPVSLNLRKHRETEVA